MHRRAFNAVVHLVSSRREFYYVRNAGYWRAVEVQVTRVRRRWWWRWWWRRRWLATAMQRVYIRVCVCVCVWGDSRRRAQSNTCAVAQKMTVIRVIILILKKKSLSRRPRLSRLPLAGELSAPFPDGARTRWNELEIDAFSRGLSSGLGGFCWLWLEILAR